MNYTIKDLIKKEEPLWGHYFMQPIGAALTILLAPFKVSPNLITILSLILAIISCWAFMADYLIIGAILINAALILDCMDGQIARMQNKKSAIGGWLDYFFDRIKDGLMIFGLAYGFFIKTGDEQILILAFLAIFLFFLRKFNTFYREQFWLKKYKQELAPHNLIKDDNSSQFRKSLKHSLSFKEADRVLFFTIIALSAQIYWGLAIYCLIQLGLVMASSFINYKKFIHEQ